jgi:hypothetical protein
MGMFKIKLYKELYLKENYSKFKNKTNEAGLISLGRQYNGPIYTTLLSEIGVSVDRANIYKTKSGAKRALNVLIKFFPQGEIIDV